MRPSLAVWGVLSVGAALTLAACSDDTKAPLYKEAGLKDTGVKDTKANDIGKVPDKGATADKGSTDGGAAAPTCAAYCDKITAACTGANVQYTDKAACNKACATEYKLKAGTAADTSGNTIGCRTYHAGAAATDPVTHCPHAGSSGANTCGTWCDVFCDTALANCTGANQVYADAPACKTACAGFATTGKPGDTSGNTVQCRIYHASEAGNAATTHCAHTGVKSAPCI